MKTLIAKDKIDVSTISTKVSENGSKTKDSSKSRKRDLVLAFVSLFVPLLAIPVTLLVLVLSSDHRVIFSDNGTQQLPIDLSSVSNLSYYTTIDVGKFTLLGSWASTVAQFVMTPFMLLFSFFIAKGFHEDVTNTNSDYVGITAEDVREKFPEIRMILELARGISKGSSTDMWGGLKYLLKKRSHHAKLRTIHVATIGALITGLFTVLLLVGDNLLHAKTQSVYQRIYEEPRKPNGSYFSDCKASFEPDATCSNTLSSSIDSTNSLGPEPCSLNVSNPIWNVESPVRVYSTLDSGISPATSGSSWDESAQTSPLDKGNGTDFQVVTYVDGKTGLSHALFFNTSASDLSINFDNPSTEDSAVDFVAKTISTVTECISATKACNIRNTRQTSNSSLSIPFNCSSMFSGDLWEAPLDGLEQFRGWYTSFYTMEEGTPRNVSVQSPLNPFHFNATMALRSIDFSTLEGAHDPQVPNGDVVDAGDGRIALALSCTATVYNVNYSFIGGNITNFNATMADPRMASIIKAPLQVGFGRFNLYMDASLALLLNGETVADAMGISFSQISMALASGVFHSTYALTQREYRDQVLTVVPKYALWFLIVVCFLYAITSVCFVVAAFMLRRKKEYAEIQVDLVPSLDLNIMDAVKGAFRKKALINDEMGRK